MELSMDAGFWRGRRVFLTGHTGFKGSWLSLWLQQLGAEVLGFALEPPTTPNLFQEAKVAEGMQSVVGDVRDAQKVLAVLRAFRPEVVIHMAAQPLVRLSYEQPALTYETNVMGTVNLLEAVRASSGVRAVVNVTTDKCYENKEWLWPYREDEPMGGHDPYSSSKGCAELVTSAYRKSFLADAGILVASARAGNVIGGGDWAADRLIPDILRAFEKSQTVIVRSPQATRPWQHVLEPLSGYMSLAARLCAEDGAQFAEGWNFGPKEDDAKPVSWIVDRMVAAWGGGTSWALDGRSHPHEANSLKLDISKARARLAWRPRWTLPESLDQIVSWHRHWLSDGDPREMTLQQIARYSTSLQN
ncbi:CDP-glucose 4,6-dehydratase [Caenimonas sedimenti]|uniref:CDP-glucose 4,6-dehydratase n=1 Tax=Caenimonas sedimenti TaxID=2596921 RepID=A0A562ZVC0_9BURK|nr:CDP-glucose 4,6-dehydratase [Caenimonas sedimenti]TWO72530.1 CDP-glucose 4,6-dehydratase [Caenimonas sedimenti]